MYYCIIVCCLLCNLTVNFISFLIGFGLGAAIYGFFAFPIIALVFEYSTQKFPEVPLNITNSIFSCIGQLLGSIVQM